MSSRRTRDPYRTPSPRPLPSARYVKRQVDSASARLTGTKPATMALEDNQLAYPRPLPRNPREKETGSNSWGHNSKVPTTPPPHDSPGSVPSLSLTPGSVSSVGIKTPETRRPGKNNKKRFQESFGIRSRFALNDTITFNTGCITEKTERVYDEVKTGQPLAGPQSPQSALEGHSREKKSAGEKNCPISLEIWDAQQTKRPSTPDNRLIPTHCTSEKPDIAAWLLETQRSSSSSDTDSIHSFESETTDDELDASPQHYVGEDTAYITPIELIDSVKYHLGHLPSRITGQLLHSLTALLWSYKVRLAAVQAVQAAAGGTISSGSYHPQGGSSSDNSKSNFNNKKRGFEEGDDNSSHMGDEDHSKRQKSNETSSLQGRRGWACPFYQREPHNYCVQTEFGDFRKCARSPGFKEVHRVKDHIYKCHSPKYCDRCFSIFKEEEALKAHRRSAPACELKQPQTIEGLTTKQKELLKPRDRKSKSDEERWYAIYKICFPQDQTCPMPYYVHYSHEIAELRRELLEIIQWETRSPNDIDVSRLLQRVDGAFNAQLSDRNLALMTPQTPMMLTPSTSNDSNRSTDKSSQTKRQEAVIETPSLKRSSERVVMTTDSKDVKVSSSELVEPSAFLSKGPPVFNLNQSNLSNGSDELLESTELSIPIRSFNDDVQPFDFEQIELEDPFDTFENDIDQSGIADFGDQPVIFERNVDQSNILDSNIIQPDSADFAAWYNRF